VQYPGTTTGDRERIRVLYSYPQKIGAGRICTTAWYQVAGVAAAGAQVTVFPGAVARSLPEGVDVRPTFARGKLRVPFSVFGQKRSLAVHDHIVARRLPPLAGQIDIVHTWPLGARETLKAAARLGIPTVLERPNAHTGFAYDVVARECERLGVELPPDHEHAYNAEYLAWEETEYRLADRLLCPSDFVVHTFLENGFAPEKLARHAYGFDESIYHPDVNPRDPSRPLTMLFVGVAAVRKGLHFALESWLRSPASQSGVFLIAGEMLPTYESRLSLMLAHPSVNVLGHRTDVPALMRRSDLFVLPTIEEGSPLASLEALGSGCVPLVSNVCSELRHMENALVHPVGDVDALTHHITLLHEDRALLARLRDGAISTAPQFTWSQAGVRLVEVYRDVVNGVHRVVDTRAPTVAAWGDSSAVAELRMVVGLAGERVSARFDPPSFWRPPRPRRGLNI
jgi:glycosyltransferase involved in cell wall biosynthesis